MNNQNFNEVSSTFSKNPSYFGYPSVQALISCINSNKKNQNILPNQILLHSKNEKLNSNPSFILKKSKYNSQSPPPLLKNNNIVNSKTDLSIVNFNIKNSLNLSDPYIIEAINNLNIDIENLSNPNNIENLNYIYNLIENIKKEKEKILENKNLVNKKGLPSISLKKFEFQIPKTSRNENNHQRSSSIPSNKYDILTSRSLKLHLIKKRNYI